jgi:hypothetical protein
LIGKAAQNQRQAGEKGFEFRGHDGKSGKCGKTREFHSRYKENLSVICDGNSNAAEYKGVSFSLQVRIESFFKRPSLGVSRFICLKKITF